MPTSATSSPAGWFGGSRIAWRITPFCPKRHWPAGGQSSSGTAERPIPSLGWLAGSPARAACSARRPQRPPGRRSSRSAKWSDCSGALAARTRFREPSQRCSLRDVVRILDRQRGGGAGSAAGPRMFRGHRAWGPSRASGGAARTAMFRAVARGARSPARQRMLFPIHSLDAPIAIDEIGTSPVSPGSHRPRFSSSRAEHRAVRNTLMLLLVPVMAGASATSSADLQVCHPCRRLGGLSYPSSARGRQEARRRGPGDRRRSS
jgi:hypothetical protein